MLFDDTPDTGYYLNNNLKKRFLAGTLKSTSVEVHRQTASARGQPLPLNRYPLAYRSTMVWPVRSEGEDATKPKFHAFFAVDSESREVFYEVWDSRLGGAIAEQACVSFELFNELLYTLASRTPTAELKVTERNAAYTKQNSKDVDRP